MSRKKKQGEKPRPRKAWPYVIGALAAGTALSVAIGRGCAPESVHPDTSRPETIKYGAHCPPETAPFLPFTKPYDSAETVFLEEPVSVRDMFEYAPSLRRISEDYALRKHIIHETVNKFYRMGSYNYFTKEFMVCSTLSDQQNFSKLIKMYAAHFREQNGFRDVQEASRKLASVPDDKFFTELVNMAYYLTRSTYKSGEININSPDAEEVMFKKNIGDCQTNSAFVVLNTGMLAENLRRPNAAKKIRLVYGFSPRVMTGTGHAWCEAAFNDRFEILECNLGGDDNLRGARFEPDRNYFSRVVVPERALHNYKRTHGFHYELQEGQPHGIYEQVSYVIPAEILKEMKHNGFQHRKTNEK
jgi:hypothetical protein